MLEVLRTDAPEMTVSPAAIVEHLDVVEQIRLCLVTSAVDPLSDPFLLQASEEGLRNCVVPTVGSPALVAAAALAVVLGHAGRSALALARAAPLPGRA